MIPTFYIAGAGERPPSQKTIFADGSADKTFQGRERANRSVAHP
jgi:hypothetical protein